MRWNPVRVLVLCAPLTVAAQEPASPDSARHPVQLDEIIVTADRMPGRASDASAINLSGGVTVAGEARITLGVDNIADTRPAGAATDLGRRWFGGLSWGIGW